MTAGAPMRVVRHEAGGLTETRDRLLAECETSARQLPGCAVPWLAARRREAAQAFGRLGLPTLRDEDWKYTSLAPLAELELTTATPASIAGEGPALHAAAAPSPTDSRRAAALATSQGQAASVLLPEPLAARHRLVFINGKLDPALSRTSELPAGVLALGLGEALARCPELLEEHLGRYAGAAEHALVALNAALWQGGALVVARAGVALEEPIHLVFVGRPERAAAHVQVRNVVLAEAGSRLAVVEHYLSGEGEQLTGAVTEARIARGAALTHYQLEEESRAAFHLASIWATVDGDGRFDSHVVAVGGRLARSEVRVALAAPGAECRLNGLYVPRGAQHLDVFTHIAHAAPHTTSNELYKGILADTARAVWTGRIFVAKDAQQTSANQANRNVLLSEGAHVNTRPQLEIYADDVKCSHGAAIGRLDADALFYLRARGIDEAEARRMLTHAFAREVVEAMPHAGLRAGLEGALASGILGGGEE